jgi:hypothetical protein
MDVENPAYRLLRLLEEGKQLDAKMNCTEAWAKLLNAPVDSPDLYARIGKVMELPSLILSAIRYAHPDNKSNLHWFFKVQQ